jgi:molybdenum cofactor cytidylyltransferase
MNLAQALRLLSFPSVAFVGAGGKSTAMFQLARELSPPVIVSATSHLGVWQIPLADKHSILHAKEDFQEASLNGVMLVTGEIEGDRTKGLDLEATYWLHEICVNNSIPLLIEADGSREKPLKAPGEYEPPIPDFVQTVVVVAGLSGLGKPLDEKTVHRPEVYTHLSGMQLGKTITPEAIIRILTHSEGGLKNIPPDASRITLLNQADTPELQAKANTMANNLLPAYDSVVIASLKEERVHTVREPIAGIILAAGEAQRFGQPKQLLDWRSEPFIRAVAKTALASGLSPIIVVTGAYADRVQAAVQDLPVQIAHNPDWQSGQASSIRAGLGSLQSFSNLGEVVGGTIFLLADQPQVTPTIIQALLEKHATTLAPVIAPMVLDQRANPVLFDRTTFPNLMRLEGDVGGRGIFSKYRVTYLTWHDDAMLLDVDTPDHYQRLKDLLE